MLAAQCSRISNKSPPPLADAAVGKGFHPWKKPPSVQTSPTHIPTSPRSGGGVSTTSSPLNYSKGTVITSSVASSNASNYSTDLLTTANTSPVGSVLGSQDNMSKLHQTDSGSLSSISNMYSRVPAVGTHPYDSAAWPYNMAASSAAVQQAAAIKGTEINNSPSSWWDFQSQALGSSAWLSDIPSATSNSIHNQLATAGNSPYSSVDYTFGSFASNTSPFLGGSGQHALQESYKSMYGAAQAADLSSTMSSALLTRPTTLASVAGKQLKQILCCRKSKCHLFYLIFQSKCSRFSLINL